MTSVLYDVPGPRAILRNRILGVATILVVAAVLAFIVYRFAVIAVVWLGKRQPAN